MLQGWLLQGMTAAEENVAVLTAAGVVDTGVATLIAAIGRLLPRCLLTGRLLGGRLLQ
jgi:hypothetical protein